MANFQIGSYQHKKLFCQLLTESTATPLDLPSLEPQTKQRLGELDVWSWVFGQLQQSGQLSQAFAQSIRGTLLQEAIAQFGDNSLTLAQSIKTLCKKNRFGTFSTQSGGTISPSENAFKHYAHQNHLMLFLACGLYELAHQANYLQPDLMGCWNHILEIQARHTLFFVNWLAFESQVKQKPPYELVGLLSFWELRSQGFAVLNKLNRSDHDDNLPQNPKEIDYFLGKWTYEDLLNACEQNYQARFASFDERLIRPNRLLKTSSAFRTLLGFWPQRVKATRPSSV